MALKSLDSEGKLRNYALLNDTNSIKSELLKFYKGNFYVTIFSKNQNLTLVPDTSSPNFFSISYFISGDYGKFLPREVRVYVIE